MTWGSVNDDLTTMQLLKMSGKMNEGEQMKGEQGDHQQNGLL